MQDDIIMSDRELFFFHFLSPIPSVFFTVPTAPCAMFITCSPFCKQNKYCTVKFPPNQKAYTMKYRLPTFFSCIS